jgi:multidrug efflux pump subunit AcrA (membrane-fusion protein)
VVGVVIVLLLVLFNFFGLFLPYVDLRPMYHVKAAFQFVPEEETSFDAPFEGVLHKVHVRPGDEVKAGQVLFEFDVRQLNIEKAGYEHEAAIAQARANSAFSEGREAEGRMAQEEMKVKQLQADLIAYKIERAQVKARYDGKVLSGDLRDKIDAPFKEGDPMMKMAKTGALQAKLFVPERDIQDVKEGKTGKLAVASAPSQKFEFVVDRIVPEGIIRDTASVFEVYVTMKETHDSWYPGLGGDAKVEVEPKTLAWIWVHRFADWAHIKKWQYFW